MMLAVLECEKEFVYVWPGEYWVSCKATSSSFNTLTFLVFDPEWQREGSSSSTSLDLVMDHKLCVYVCVF